jgi:hypothetical protein
MRCCRVSDADDAPADMAKLQGEGRGIFPSPFTLQRHARNSHPSISCTPTTDGAECWVLVHIEVQTARDAEFPRRMYVYNYRVFDRFNRPVASLAVLADDDPAWRPTDFRSSLFGCEAGLRFPVVKLLDLAADEAMLVASVNPFAQAAPTHLKERRQKAMKQINAPFPNTRVFSGLPGIEGGLLFRPSGRPTGLPKATQARYTAAVAAAPSRDAPCRTDRT